MIYEELQQTAAEHRKWVSPAATAFVAIRQHKDARSVLFRIAKSLVRWRFGNVESDILDFGDAGGVVVAGYLDPVAMRYLREGQVPLAWRKRAKKDTTEAPKPERTYKDRLDDARADADGAQSDMEPGPFLGEYTPVRVEDKELPPAEPAPRPVLNLTHRDANGTMETEGGAA